MVEIKLGRKEGWLLKGMGFFVGGEGDENVQKLVLVMIVQLYEYIVSH